MRRIGVGIIGFAHNEHGYEYARCFSINRNTALVALADEDEKRGTNAAEKLETSYYKDYNELLGLDTVNAVCICSETAKRAKLVIAAAEAGKHILCDSPMATKLEDAEQMIEKASSTGVKLMIGARLRFNSVMTAARNLIYANALGVPVFVYSTRFKREIPAYSWLSDPVLAGGGCIMNLGLPIVDYIRWLISSDVDTVYGETGKLKEDASVEDFGVIHLQFKNRMMSAIAVGWGGYGRSKTHRKKENFSIEVIGTDGYFRVNPPNTCLEVYSESDPYKGVRWESCERDAANPLVKGFVTGILKDETPLVTGQDGKAALEAVLAVYESRKIREPLKLPIA